MDPRPQNIQKREAVVVQKSLNKTQNKTKNFGPFNLINKCLFRKSAVIFQKSPTANMYNGEFDKPSRD